MDSQTIVHFANTRDNLRPASIAALIDFAEGNPFALFAEMWIFGALERLDLVRRNTREWMDDERMGIPHTTPMLDLTDYGRAFVAWYRQPRDLPAQMDMFEALDA